MRCIRTIDAVHTYSVARGTVLCLYAVMKERLNLVLTAPQRTWLEREAKRLGLSIQELVRRLIDNLREAK